MAVVGLCLVGAVSCREQVATPRAIRAHTRIVSGVSHAEPIQKPERYCAACHGQGLVGGLQGEPSCFTCHGQNWEAGSFAASDAPGDHTEVRGEYRHHPELFVPLTRCVTCHGETLGGQVEGGLTQPGCDLCHDRPWEAAAAP